MPVILFNGNTRDSDCDCGGNMATDRLCIHGQLSYMVSCTYMSPSKVSSLPKCLHSENGMLSALMPSAFVASFPTAFSFSNHNRLHKSKQPKTAKRKWIPLIQRVSSFQRSREYIIPYRIVSCNIHAILLHVSTGNASLDPPSCARPRWAKAIK